MKALIPWTGGKTRLLKTIKQNLPASYNHYYEPFIGGGSVLLDLLPESATINDHNDDLIMLYQALKENKDKLFKRIQKHFENDSKDYYLQIRNLDRDTDAFSKLTNVEKAARMFYLIKRAYGNLWRTNKKGQMNTSYRTDRTGKMDMHFENLESIHHYLNSHDVKIVNTDFEEVVASAKKGDFVYFDPPYIPLKPGSDFTSYTKEGFTYADQVRLKDCFIDLTNRGVYVMISNSSAALTYDLYKDIAKRIINVDIKHMIGARSKKPETIQEVLIMNY